MKIYKNNSHFFFKRGGGGGGGGGPGSWVLGPGSAFVNNNEIE